MVKTYEIPEQTIQAVINNTAWESDIYRIAYGYAFRNMNNQAQSFQSKARTALSNGDALTAYEFVQKAHAVIQDYERSPLFIEGKTSGIRGSLGKLESRILSCQ